MRMNLQDNVTAMEKAIGEWVTSTLSNIRKDSIAGVDLVLDDKNGIFKNMFLNTAKNKLLTAYKTYVIQAEFENRNGNHKLNYRAANGPQEELVAQSTSKKIDKPFSPGKATTTNSVNPFESDLMNQQPVNQKPLNQQPLNQQPLNQQPLNQQPLNQQPLNQFLHSRHLCEDVSEKTKEEELQLQKRLLSIVEIVGLPIRERDQKSLKDLFKVFCDHIMSFDKKEIESIRSEGEILTVTFYDKKKVDKLFQRFRHIKYPKSNDILQLLPGEMAKPVKIFRKTTHFYRQICNLAHDYAMNKQLYSYQLCSKGLRIKFTAWGEVVYVRSLAELNHLIGQNEKKEHSLVAPPVPPRRNTTSCS